jgi:thiamine transport system substrate-binding protein
MGLMRVRPIAIACVVSGVVLLTACGGTDTASGPDGAGGDASKPTGSVRLLAHDSFVLSETLLADFTEETGLTVEVVTGGDAGTMVAGAVLAAGSPTADVMYGVDSTLLSRAVDAGVFEPYLPADIGVVAPELLEGTADGTVTPIDYGDVCINIDDATLAGLGVSAPTTLDDLTKPEYRDLLVVQDPGTSSPGLAFLLATIARFGDGWPDYWRQLSENGVKVASSWTDAYVGDFSGGGDGDRPLVVSYATSPPAEIVYATEPKPTEPSTSVMTDGCYRQVEYAGVLAGAANPDGARTLIDWLLTEPVQADVPLSMFVFPARTGTPLPEVFTDFAAVVDAPLELPSDEVAANLTGWLDEWGTVMGR